MESFKAGDPKFDQWLDRVVQEGAKAGLLSFAMRLVQHITTDLIPSYPRPPVDQGAYRAGWQYKKIDKGARIYNTSPIAAIVEYGVRPENVKAGRAMREALAKWILRKGLAADEKEATQMSFAIAMKMKTTGIFFSTSQGAQSGGGLRILERALEKTNPWLREEIGKEIERKKKKGK